METKPKRKTQLRTVNFPQPSGCAAFQQFHTETDRNSLGDSRREEKEDLLLHEHQIVLTRTSPQSPAPRIDL